ncbi:hypothetical protein ES708_11535 [subsurface metagenome]
MKEWLRRNQGFLIAAILALATACLCLWWVLSGRS